MKESSEVIYVRECLADEIKHSYAAAFILLDKGNYYILKHLSEHNRDTLIYEIAKTEKFTNEFLQTVIEDYNNFVKSNKTIIYGGLDKARVILEESVGTQKAIDTLNNLTRSIKVKPFDFVARQDVEHLYNFIQNEHPQTIALILSYLDSDKASKLLSKMPRQIQADIARRISKLDKCSPEILREIERVLERKLSTLSNEDYTQTGGVEFIVDILNKADRQIEKSIMEGLEEEDPELAEEIKKRMFVFEDIVLIDDNNIKTLLESFNKENWNDLAISLKAVDTDVKEKILRNCSYFQKRTLNKNIKKLGVIRLKDVEISQKFIVDIIKGFGLNENIFDNDILVTDKIKTNKIYNKIIKTITSKVLNEQKFKNGSIYKPAKPEPTKTLFQEQLDSLIMNDESDDGVQEKRGVENARAFVGTPTNILSILNNSPFNRGSQGSAELSQEEIDTLLMGENDDDDKDDPKNFEELLLWCNSLSLGLLNELIELSKSNLFNNLKDQPLNTSRFKLDETQISCLYEVYKRNYK